MPPGVLTVTAAVPLPVGLSATIEVGDSTLYLAAGVAPKLTAVAPVKPEPSIVTEVLPASGPSAGVSFETVGGSE